MCYRELAISTCTDIPDVRFRRFEFMGILPHSVNNGFILGYVAIYNFKIFLIKNLQMSQFSVRLESAITERFLEKLIDF